MNHTRFNITAFGYGFVWYGMLSLPLSPASNFILASGTKYPNWPLLVLMCMASLGSAQFYWLDLKLLPNEEQEHPLLTASALTTITACTFGALVFILTLVTMAHQGFLSAFPFVVIECIGGILMGIFYGAYFGLMSVHVAIPTGFVGMVLLKRAAGRRANETAGPFQNNFATPVESPGGVRPR